MKSQVELTDEYDHCLLKAINTLKMKNLCSQLNEETNHVISRVPRKSSVQIALPIPKNVVEGESKLPHNKNNNKLSKTVRSTIDYKLMISKLKQNGKKEPASSSKSPLFAFKLLEQLNKQHEINYDELNSKEKRLSKRKQRKIMKELVHLYAERHKPNHEIDIKNMESIPETIHISEPVAQPNANSNRALNRNGRKYKPIANDYNNLIPIISPRANKTIDDEEDDDAVLVPIVNKSISPVSFTNIQSNIHHPKEIQLHSNTSSMNQYITDSSNTKGLHNNIPSPITVSTNTTNNITHTLHSNDIPLPPASS